MNGSTKQKLIAVDCDGTFFDKSHHPSSRTYHCAQLLEQSGHKIVACTGRSRISASHRLKKVAGMQYIVCSNGAYIWDNHQDRLFSGHLINRQSVLEIVTRLRDTFLDCSFGWESATGIGFEHNFVKLAGGIDQLENGGVAGELLGQNLYKIYVRRPSVFRFELLKQIAMCLKETPCEISTSGAPFIEITAPGANKANGLQEIACHLGFTAADTIAFGDNDNDIPMLKWAHHSVAMGNAIESVVEVATHTTLSNDKDGVAQYLEQFLALRTARK